MKKFIPHIFTAAIITSISMVNTIHTYPKTKAVSEANLLGQQTIRELGQNVEEANKVFEFAVGEEEHQNAQRNARDAAHTLINTLNDVRTFGNDTVKGYNPSQRRQAAIMLAEFLMRQNALEIKIKSERMKIADMTDSGLIYDSAITGKSEARAKAIKEQKVNHTALREVEQNISHQANILGQAWTRTITIAINSLMAGTALGIAYGIDWYAVGHSARLLGDNNIQQPVMYEEPAPRQIKSKPARRQKIVKPSQKLNPQERAAVKSWNRLSKNKLLSKEIATAYELTQAQDLMAQLENISNDLANVPVRHQPVLGRVNAAIDSLSRRIERARGNLINNRWIK